MQVQFILKNSDSVGYYAKIVGYYAKIAKPRRIRKKRHAHTRSITGKVEVRRPHQQTKVKINLDSKIPYKNPNTASIGKLNGGTVAKIHFTNKTEV